MKLVFIGPSVSVDRGEIAAEVSRGLLQACAARGHEILYLEPDRPWSPGHESPRELPGIDVNVYLDHRELERHYTESIRDADAVIVSSGLRYGVSIGYWVLRHARGVTAFYDFDPATTLSQLRRGTPVSISAEQVRRYQVYLSASAGPVLNELERAWGSPAARPLFAAIDPDALYPEARAALWDLGFVGNYRADRQGAFERLMLRPAERLADRTFIVAGTGYPADIVWPENTSRLDHLMNGRRRGFYAQQRLTLNLTSNDLLTAGWSPNLELLEAAACGTAVISDCWPGIDQFFTPGHEVLLATTSDDVARIVRGLSEADSRAIGDAARRRVLDSHTFAHRAEELEHYLGLAGEVVPARNTGQHPARRHTSGAGTSNGHEAARLMPVHSK